MTDNGATYSKYFYLSDPVKFHMHPRLDPVQHLGAMTTVKTHRLLKNWASTNPEVAVPSD